MQSVRPSHEADAKDLAGVEEEKGKRADEAMASSRELLGRLASGVAHEVGNLAQILEIEGRELAMLGGEVAEQAETVAALSRRAHILVLRLLTLRASGHDDPRDLDVLQLLRGLKGLLSDALRGRHPLRFVLAGACGRVRFDAGQLEQIALELVLNARDASSAGDSIEVGVAEVRLVEELIPHNTCLKPGVYCCLHVRDHGCGVSPELQGQVFEPFYSSRGERALGLGLTFVRERARQHGGDVTLESAPGEGSCVRIYLPVATPLDR